MNPFNQELLAGVSPEEFFLLVAISIWELVWKGFALWKAAQKKDNLWFVVLLLINSAGLIPALYIFYISKRKKGKKLISVKLPNLSEHKKEEDEKKSSTKISKKK